MFRKIVISVLTKATIIALSLVTLWIVRLWVSAVQAIAQVGFTTLNAADPFLDLQDGWIKLIEDNGNVADQSGAAITKAVFKDGKKTMPDQYLKNVSSLRQYVSMDQETEYRDTVASRGTALGDATLTGNNPLFVFGSPISPVQQMPGHQVSEGGGKLGVAPVVVNVAAQHRHKYRFFFVQAISKPVLFRQQLQVIGEFDGEAVETG